MSHDLAVALIEAIVANLRKAPEQWDSMAMVLDFDTERVYGTSGFVYDAAGEDTSVAVSPYLIKDAAASYTATHYAPGTPRPVSLLVQFDRPTGQYEMTFEDRDEDRWRLTPKSFPILREALRPKFD